jgi:hypothetical protein
MEIRTGIDLKRTKLAMDLNLRGESLESTPVADVIWMGHKPTSEKMKLNGNDLPVKPNEVDGPATCPAALLRDHSVHAFIGERQGSKLPFLMASSDM